MSKEYREWSVVFEKRKKKITTNKHIQKIKKRESKKRIKNNTKFKFKFKIG